MNVIIPFKLKMRRLGYIVVVSDVVVHYLRLLSLDLCCFLPALFRPVLHALLSLA